MSIAFSRPRALEAAFEELGDDDALILAGGQSLVLLMNLGLLYPEKLVSVAGIPDLQGLSATEEALDIGALCTHDRLASHPAVVANFPAAADMFSGIGNVRVRASGTLGGNLVHADPAQDPAVMLTVLDAHAVVARPEGSRLVAVEDLAMGPLMSVLEPDEILTRVRVPLPAGRVSCSYVKFLSGTQDDYATVSLAARIAFDDAGRVADARLAAGAVGPTVVTLQGAAGLLVGHRLDDEDALRSLRDAVRDAVSPFPDRRGSADYKREMAGVVAAQAVRTCGSTVTIADQPTMQGPKARHDDR